MATSRVGTSEALRSGFGEQSAQKTADRLSESEADKKVMQKYVSKRQANTGFDTLTFALKGASSKQASLKIAVDTLKLEFEHNEGKMDSACKGSICAPFNALKQFIDIKMQFPEIANKLCYALTVESKPDVWSLELIYNQQTICTFVSTSDNPFHSMVLPALEKIGAKYQLYQHCQGKLDNGCSLSYQEFTGLLTPVSPSTTDGNISLEDAFTMVKASAELVAKLPVSARQLITLQLVDADPAVDHFAGITTQPKFQVIKIVIGDVVVEERKYKMHVGDSKEAQSQAETRALMYQAAITKLPERIKLLKWAKPNAQDAVAVINKSLKMIKEAKNLADLVAARDALKTILDPKYHNRLKLTCKIIDAPNFAVDARFVIEGLRNQNVEFACCVEEDDVLMPSADYLTCLEHNFIPKQLLNNFKSKNGSDNATNKPVTVTKASSKADIDYLVGLLEAMQQKVTKKTYGDSKTCQFNLIERLGENLTIPSVRKAYKDFVMALKRVELDNATAEAQKQAALMEAQAAANLAAKEAAQELQQLMDSLNVMPDKELLERGDGLMAQFFDAKLSMVRDDDLIKSLKQTRSHLTELKGMIETAKMALAKLNDDISTTNLAKRVSEGYEQIRAYKFAHAEAISLDATIEQQIQIIEKNLQTHAAEEKQTQLKKAQEQRLAQVLQQIEQNASLGAALKIRHVKTLIQAIQSSDLPKDQVVRQFNNLHSIMSPQFKSRFQIHESQIDLTSKTFMLEVDEAVLAKFTLNTVEDIDELSQVRALIGTFKRQNQRPEVSEGDREWVQMQCTDLEKYLSPIHGELGVLKVPVPEAIEKISAYFSILEEASVEDRDMKLLDGELQGLVSQLGGVDILNEPEISQFCNSRSIKTNQETLTWNAAISNILAVAV
ncbi:hypothetical protein D5018_13970 [Parashewanella curva]|uniref:Uncharacterized protein n=1 Tax=Parashewanella curva TaxID=2338552 RepID=A0A3L8PYH4_9GAMM|nr:hypothetical protein [Parashewanella curva]RLV59112.1 hypothetical protein D5018_13970 [Parashewanella curva]